MLFNALVGKPEFRKHAPLLVRQLYNVGVLSMLIIVVSGVFIGMVLGLQGYLVLTTYGETSLGMLVALSLLRELGAGGCRVVVCRACGFGANRNRPDALQATLQYGDDGGGSAASGYFSPFLGWGYFITTVDGYFRRRGDLGRISGRRQLERH